MSNSKSDNKHENVPKVRVRTGVKAGDGSLPLLNHGVRIRTGVKAGDGGGLPLLNHGLRVRTGVKAGDGGDGTTPGTKLNHGLRVRQASR